MKKFTALFLAIIISLSAVSSAFAAKWVEVIRNDATIIYVDTSSIQYNGNTIRVWEKYITRHKKHPLAYGLEFTEYNINNKTVKKLSVEDYDKNGKCVFNYDFGEDDELAPAFAIRPDSDSEYVFNFCIKQCGIINRMKNWFKQHL